VIFASSDFAAFPVPKLNSEAEAICIKKRVVTIKVITKQLGTIKTILLEILVIFSGNDISFLR
jgi:hypothetical protein